MAKQALGKGLGALIRRPTSTSGSAPTGATTTNATNAATAASPSGADEDRGERVQLVVRSRIVQSPLQPRKHFREDFLQELVDSIREHGVIQPLIVREVAGKLELIAGERRWRAAEKLGLADVPVIVREASDRDVLEMALIENLQREDLNPVEEAEAYVRLAKEFGMRQEDIAKRVGKNRATVANAMRLLDLDPDVQVLLAQGRISTGHAKVLLSAREFERQRFLADQIIKKGLTVRATERLLSQTGIGGATRGGTGRSDGPRAGDPTLHAAIEDVAARLRSRFGTQVAVSHGPKKGRIEIEYYGSEDLDRILGLMGIATESELG